MGFGFVFITLGVIFGVMWAFIELGTRWIGERQHLAVVRDLGLLPGHDLPARVGGLARTQSRGDGAGGAGLRRADLGRARRIEADADPMKLLITGLNHHTAPVEVREKLAFEEKTLPRGSRPPDASARAWWKA